MDPLWPSGLLIQKSKIKGSTFNAGCYFSASVKTILDDYIRLCQDHVSHLPSLNFYIIIYSLNFLGLTFFHFPLSSTPCCSNPSCLSPHPSIFALSGSLYRLLLELLELLFDKFKAVAQAHSVVLAHLQHIAVQYKTGAHEEGIKLYEQADVSAKIQTVLQVR